MYSCSHWVGSRFVLLLGSNTALLVPSDRPCARCCCLIVGLSFHPPNQATQGLVGGVEPSGHRSMLCHVMRYLDQAWTG